MTTRKPNILFGLMLGSLSVSLIACGVGLDSATGSKDHGDGVFEGPIPRAVCGPGSQTEPGMQGEGATTEESRCNMELVGHQGTGASWQLATYEDCAYYNQNFPGAAVNPTPGTVVVDASDPSRPVSTAHLTSPAMLDPHESLSANEARGLLGAVAGWDALGNGPVFFDVYDVSGDCTRPILYASVPVNLPNGHEGEWAPDGLTYYGVSQLTEAVNAIDVTNPSQPTLIRDLRNGSHGLSVSDEGNRGYFTGAGCGNGLEILDLSQIQARDPNPAAPLVGEVCWDDGFAAQHTIPVTIKGRPYIIFVDEGGAGAARIIDISDEKNPIVISKLKLEVHMLPASNTPFMGGAWNAHYCGVSRRDEPDIVACSYLTSGLRIFDIRDPYHPREIAYYKPPLGVNGSTEPLILGGVGRIGPSARTRIRQDRGEVWFTDQESGFYIVRFTNGVWPFPDASGI